MKKFRYLFRENEDFESDAARTLKEKPNKEPMKTVKEAVKDKFDIGEYDQEGDMAKSDLRSIMSNAKRVHDMLEDSDNLPEWVQSKITKAEDYMSTVANYMEAEMNEEAESVPASKSLQKAHEDERKRRGLPDPDYYLKLRDQKKKEIENMKKEEVESLEEKNVPTSPEKWAQAKAQAKAKFDVYPSAYANGWAAKKYKAMGGGWKSVSEEVEGVNEGLMASMAAKMIKSAANTKTPQEIANSHIRALNKKAPGTKMEGHPNFSKFKSEVHSYVSSAKTGEEALKRTMDNHVIALGKKHFNEESELEEGYYKSREIERQETERLAKQPPFTPDKPKKQAVAGKKPEGYSTARHLARQAMKKYVKEEDTEKFYASSRKTQIVKNAAKNKNENKFEPDPVLSKLADKKD